MRKTLFVLGMAVLLYTAMFRVEFVASQDGNKEPTYNPDTGMWESKSVIHELESTTVSMVAPSVTQGMRGGGNEAGKEVRTVIPPDEPPSPGASGGGVDPATFDRTPKWIVTRQSGDDVVVWGTLFDEILGLTPEQTNALQAVTDRMRPGSTLSPENRRVLSISNAVNFLTLADVQSTIDQTLTPDQRLQYAEISFQAGGGLDSRHLNDQFLGVLKLTGAQKDQIRKMTAEYAKEVAEVVSARRETLRQQYGEPKPLKAPPPFDWLNATQAEKDKYIAEIAADAYDHAMNDPVNVAYMKAQPSYREEDEARAKRHNERVKALLTLEQKKKAEKLTAEAPALVAKIMNRNKEPDASKLATKEQRGQQDQKEQKGQKEQTPAWIYVPNDGSWRPGEPLPNQIERKPGNFPRKKAEQ